MKLPIRRFVAAFSFWESSISVKSICAE